MFTMETGWRVDPSPETGDHEKSPGQGIGSTTLRAFSYLRLRLAPPCLSFLGSPAEHGIRSDPVELQGRRNWACLDFEPGRLSECSIPGLLRLGGAFGEPVWPRGWSCPSHAKSTPTRGCRTCLVLHGRGGTTPLESSVAAVAQGDL
eukprot:s604_g13.t1